MQSRSLSFNKRHRKPLVKRGHQKDIHRTEYAVDIGAHARKYHAVRKTESFRFFLYLRTQAAVADKKQGSAVIDFLNLGKNIDKKRVILLDMETRGIAHNKFSA